ncbi:MAG: TerD family protein, partial [Trichodesmium sp. MAG_R04]|nr:TerD family protein [Trichodesmium sp. MAG_R04]
TNINFSIEELLFVVTIHEAEKRRQNFGQVKNSFIRIYDLETQEEIIKYELEEDFSRETAIEFGRLYKKNGEWRFQAVGTGYNAGLQTFVEKYVY